MLLPFSTTSIDLFRVLTVFGYKRLNPSGSCGLIYGHSRPGSVGGKNRAERYPRHICLVLLRLVSDPAEYSLRVKIGFQRSLIYGQGIYIQIPVLYQIVQEFQSVLIAGAQLRMSVIPVFIYRHRAEVPCHDTVQTAVDRSKSLGACGAGISSGMPCSCGTSPKKNSLYNINQ